LHNPFDRIIKLQVGESRAAFACQSNIFAVICHDLSAQIKVSSQAIRLTGACSFEGADFRSGKTKSDGNSCLYCIGLQRSMSGKMPVKTESVLGFRRLNKKQGAPQDTLFVTKERESLN